MRAFLWSVSGAALAALVGIFTNLATADKPNPLSYWFLAGSVIAMGAGSWAAGRRHGAAPPSRLEPDTEPIDLRSARTELSTHISGGSIRGFAQVGNVAGNFYFGHKSRPTWILPVTCTLISLALLGSLIVYNQPSLVSGAPYSVSLRLGADAIDLPAGYEDDLSPGGGAQAFYFPRSLLPAASQPPGNLPNGCDASRKWAVDNGGLDYRTTYGEAILTANANLVVRGARVDVAHRDLPGGDIAACPIGAPLGATYLAVNLDDGTVQKQRTDSGGARTESTPVGFQLRPGESERIGFVAETENVESTLISWTLILDTLIDGVETEIRIDDSGTAFQTSSRGDSENKIYVYEPISNRWESGE